MKTSWYQEPWAWLVFILPFTAVVAGIATFIIANTNPDTLVVGDYYKKGKAINLENCKGQGEFLLISCEKQGEHKVRLDKIRAISYF